MDTVKLVDQQLVVKIQVAQLNVDRLIDRRLPLVRGEWRATV